MNTPEANAQLEQQISNLSRRGKVMIEKNMQQERSSEPVHPARTYDTWDEVDIHAAESKPWVRPTSLEAPAPRTGFVQRWIRVGTGNSDDPTNTARKFREGWKPRPASSIPSSYHAPTIQHGKWVGCIGVEGMLLCEMPETMVKKRADHYAARTDLVTNTIAAELQKQSRPGMPIVQERSSKMSRSAHVMDD